MKIQLTGKVLERTSRKLQDGSTRYYIVIEEPGNYPSPFQFSAKTPDLFGPSNGFAAVGNIVTASGFANGRCDEFQRKDGNGTWKKYSVYLSLLTLQPYASAAPAAPQESVADSKEPEDIPF